MCIVHPGHLRYSRREAARLQVGSVARGVLPGLTWEADGSLLVDDHVALPPTMKQSLERLHGTEEDVMAETWKAVKWRQSRQCRALHNGEAGGGVGASEFILPGFIHDRCRNWRRSCGQATSADANSR